MAGDSEDEDMVPDVEKIHKLLLQTGMRKNQFFRKVVPGGKHNETLWAKEFAAAYAWLME